MAWEGYKLLRILLLTLQLDHSTLHSLSAPYTVLFSLAFLSADMAKPPLSLVSEKVAG